MATVAMPAPQSAKRKATEPAQGSAVKRPRTANATVPLTAATLTKVTINGLQQNLIAVLTTALTQTDAALAAQQERVAAAAAQEHLDATALTNLAGELQPLEQQHDKALRENLAAKAARFRKAESEGNQLAEGDLAALWLTTPPRLTQLYQQRRERNLKHEESMRYLRHMQAEQKKLEAKREDLMREHAQLRKDFVAQLTELLPQLLKPVLPPAPAATAPAPAVVVLN